MTQIQWDHFNNKDNQIDQHSLQPFEFSIFRAYLIISSHNSHMLAHSSLDRFISARPRQPIITPRGQKNLKDHRNRGELYHLMIESMERNHRTCKSNTNQSQRQMSASSIHLNHHNNHLKVESKEMTAVKSIKQELSELISQMPPPRPATKTIIPSTVISVSQLSDNFYYSPFDISTQSKMALVLGDECFIKNIHEQREISEAIKIHRWGEQKFDFWSQLSNVTSVKFAGDGGLICLGDQTGKLQIVDALKNKPIRRIKAHYSRIGTIASINSHMLITGSKDTCITLTDLRIQRPIVSSFQLPDSHQQGEVCGLSYKNEMIASGYNGGKVAVWDLKKNSIVEGHSFHKGAVKAIGWCPWKSGVLCSGGGSKDHQLIVYSASTSSTISRIKTPSQITSLDFREKNHHMLTSHRNQSVDSRSFALVWDVASQHCPYYLKGRFSRMLVARVDPQNENKVISCFGDEIMQMYDIPQ